QASMIRRASARLTNHDFVQALVTEAAVETFDVRILDGLAWRDEVQRDAVRIGPLIQRPTDEFWAIVENQLAGQPARGDEPLENLDDAGGGQRGVYFARQVHPSEGVDHIESPKLSARHEAIFDEVDRPAFVDTRGRRPAHDGRPRQTLALA